MKGTYLEAVSFHVVLSTDLFRHTPSELLVIFERRLCVFLRERRDFTCTPNRLHREQKRNHIRLLIADIRKLRSLVGVSKQNKLSAAGVIKQLAAT